MKVNRHPVRVIVRLDIKGRKLVKGVNLEGLRVIGDPIDFIRRYIEMDADEIVIIDINANLYGFEHDYEYLSEISSHVNIPITVGGGVRTIEHFEKVLKAGADKVSANTVFTDKPEMISEFARIFGRQAVVLYVESKFQGGGTFNDGTYRAYTENGRSRTNLIVEEWVEQAQDLGCGEVILTSIDAEGREEGFDEEIISRVVKRLKVPLVISGGYGRPEHLDILTQDHIDGLAIATTFHYGRATVKEIKDCLHKRGLTVRYA